MVDAAQLARELLRIEAVRLRPEAPFTWASGIESPIYTDNRVALAFPEVRTSIADGLTALARASGDFDAVAGVATAGIPHATLVADRLGLPLAYVRSSAKAHGRGNRIEGRLTPKQRVVVVEDLISTGGSSLDAVAALRDAGVVVVTTIAIFTYGFAAAEDRFAEANCPLATLTDYPPLLAEAEASGYVHADHIETLKDWRTATSAALS